MVSDSILQRRIPTIVWTGYQNTFLFPTMYLCEVEFFFLTYFNQNVLQQTEYRRIYENLTSFY